MKKQLLIYTSCILFSCVTLRGFAQNECGTDFIHQQLMQTDSVYRNHFLNLEQQIKTIIQSQNNPYGPQPYLQTAVYTIPVVVHVIHLGEAVGTGTNISDVQIQGAINGLNDRFRKIIGSSSGGDIEIQFCFAARDPNGNSTTGIIRVDGSSVPLYSSGGIKRQVEPSCDGIAAEDTTIKNLSKWPVSDYYNIWVVNKICGGWAGYAYYPWGGAYDGTVIDRNYMTYSSSTLAHELGHGFYLYHTFQDDGGNVSCPVDTSCMDNGDKVCDTPPHKQGDCGVSNPCTGTGIWDNSRYNYMSYCFPSQANARFTNGQKDRARAAAVVYPRLSLLTSLGCTPANSNDAGIETVIYPIQTTYTQNCTFPNSITPVVKLRNYGTNSLTSVTINYKLDNNSLNNYSWNGSLSGGSSINVILPTLSASQGNHTFLAFTSSPNGLSDGYGNNDSSNVVFNYKTVQPFTLTNSTIDASCYSGSNGSATVSIVPKTEITENWEGSTDWTIVNGSQLNKWFVGTSTSNGGSKSIYITNDNNSNAYTDNSSSIVHFYKDFDFPANATNITIKFDWKGYGKSGYDYMRVYLIPTSTIPAAGYQLSSGQIGTTYNLQSTFTTATITGLDANAGTTKRLVFSWRNYGSGGIQPPSAVDNIIVSYNTVFNNPYSYSWNTSPIQTTATANNLSTGNYTATVTDNSGCTATSSVSISQPTAISLTTTQTNVLCNGGNNGSATVNATGGTLTQTVNTIENWEGSYTWTLVNGTQTNKWFVGSAISNGGTKSIYVSNDNNSNAYTITASSTVHFYKNFTFPANATNIKIKFDWQGFGENNNDYLRVFLAPTSITPAAGTAVSTTYQIGNSQYNLQSFFSTATISGLDANAGTTKRLIFSWRNNTSVGTQPPAAIDNIIVSYDIPGAYSYSWNTTPVQSTATANNLSAGNYTVTVTDVNSCTNTTSVIITQPSPIPVTITPSGATTFCQGNSVTLTASAANSYLWSEGSTTQSITVSTSGNYSVTVTDGNGCSASSTPETVTVNLLPTATITPSGATTFCQGNSVTLTASAATSYLWSEGSTTQSITVSTSGNYSVTVTDGNGCSASSTPETVTVNPLPTATITPSGATTFCQGNSVTLTASAATSYLWSEGSTTQSITVSTSGNYSVTVTDGNGCSASSTPETVTVNPLPTATITPSGATTFCQGGNVTLTASAATSYLWSEGSTTQSITVSTSGNYSVTVTDGNGCSASSTPETVIVDSLPIAIITPSSSTTFCQGDSVILIANTGSGYLWSIGNTTQSIVVYISGNYSVSVTNSCGSANSTPTTVTVNPLPTATITPSGATTFCQGGNVTLTASAATSYLWSEGSTTQSITVSTSGNYSVTVTDGNGCSASSTPETVTVNIVDTSITVNGFTLTSNAASATYQWLICPTFSIISGEINQSYSPTQNGTYAVIVSQNGCIDTSFCYQVTITGLAFTNSAMSIVVYPNPTNSLLTIKGIGLTDDNYEMTLTNSLGQLLNKKEITINGKSLETQIDINEYSTGIYFLTISSKTVNHVFKIQKQQ